MSAQRARSAVNAEHRSVHPGIAGVPWWGAIVIAAALTTLGFAFDAGTGSKQLTTVFAALYVVGCVVAVLAVQQSGLFTAVVQPPLILFVSVPGAYFLFHGATFTGLKNLAINCGYPLIERFPLMLFGSAAVLLIGLARWSFGLTSRDADAAASGSANADDTADEQPDLLASLVGKLTSIWAGGTAGDDDREGGPRRHTIDRSARTNRRAAAERPARAGRPRPDTADLNGDRPPRPRRPRPLVDDAPEFTAERPTRARRPRPPAAGYPADSTDE
ncbi:MAG TPA: DUF6542 domain-containing protein, partial [Mycobacterium sp.]|nr:DUF6542 domain-containing protein [Mycobacterium sp.]